MNQNQMTQKNGTGQHNILLPLPKEMESNSLYRYTLNEVSVDTSPTSGDIFSVGKVNDVERFSLTKPVLMKLSVAAGIQFDPNNTGGEYLNKNTYKGRAFGAMLLTDGSTKTHFDEKVINLEDEEDNFRLDYHKKSIEGVIGPKAFEASKLYAGKWQEITSKKGKKLNAFFVDREDRESFIQYSTIAAMTQLRKTMAEKAVTGAVLRVIRALTGVKSGYTKEELSIPFAIPRVVFVPDMSDPTVKRAMIDRGLNATTSMFKQTSVTPVMEQQTPPPSSFQSAFDVTELLTQEEPEANLGDVEVIDQGNVQRPEGNPPLSHR